HLRRLTRFRFGNGPSGYPSKDGRKYNEPEPDGIDGGSCHDEREEREEDDEQPYDGDGPPFDRPQQNRRSKHRRKPARKREEETYQHERETNDDCYKKPCDIGQNLTKQASLCTRSPPRTDPETSAMLLLCGLERSALIPPGEVP